MGVVGTNSIQYVGMDKYLFSLSIIFVDWVWLFILGGIGRFIGKLDQSRVLMQIFNKTSAIIMWGIAFYMLGTILND
jgi:L-lysine exporter family protein LysE/ArgO